MTTSRRRFTDSLSYTLAKNSVLVTLIVGFSLSFIQIGLDYLREQDAMDKFASEILAANQFAAADASFHLDSPAAEEVAKGILQYYYITSVIITNESDEILAQRTPNIARTNGHNKRYDIFGEIKKFNQTLYSTTGENIGNLAIYIDPVLASEGFVDRSLLVLISGLVRNILMAFILICVFYLTITKKVIAVSSVLKNLDPINPTNNRIPMLNVKKKNELDDLGEGINRMLTIISSDIQDREQREKELYASQKELSYQANHDALTELINRRGFEHLVQEAMQCEHPKLVLCYLDLDQFKIINDTCGHAAGDELLRQVSHLIQRHIRSDDTLARLGGDEFGILMQNCNIGDAALVAQKLIDQIGQYRFFWEGKPFAITVSIGVSSISDKVQTTYDLLRNADIACYTAKDAGRNCFRVYEAGVSDAARLHSDMEWVNKINQALENNGFCLYAQKIVPNMVKSGAGLHYEVLLRMLNDEGEIIPPNAFLPAAERYHLMTKIDKWVIKHLFEYLSTHPAHLSEVTLCSINISGPSLTVPEFQQTVIDSLHYYKIPAAKICFEITETTAISNLTDAITFIDAMHERGCSFALDDFGTGLSSFAYLKYLPVDYLKIDGVFVKGIVEDPIDFAMVKSIHEVAIVMGKKTVAEFVENRDIELKLNEIGVHYSQGFGIAKPCPIDELTASKLPSVGQSD